MSCLYTVEYSCPFFSGQRKRQRHDCTAEAQRYSTQRRPRRGGAGVPHEGHGHVTAADINALTDDGRSRRRREPKSTEQSSQKLQLLCLLLPKAVNYQSIWCPCSWTYVREKEGKTLEDCTHNRTMMSKVLLVRTCDGVLYVPCTGTGELLSLHTYTNQKEDQCHW